MLIGQRARELALLRALGASRGQVIRSVLGEAVVIGLVGSGLGIALRTRGRAGAEAAIRSLLGTDIGAGLPLHPTTIALSVLVGTAGHRHRSRTARTPCLARRTSGGHARGRRVGRRWARQAWFDRPRRCSSQVPWSSVARVTRTHVSWTVAAAWRHRCCAGDAGRRSAGDAPRRACHRLAVRRGHGCRRQARPRERAARPASYGDHRQRPDDRARTDRWPSPYSRQSVKASVSDGVDNELTSDFVLNSGNIAPVPTPVADAARALPGVRSVAEISALAVRVGHLPHDRVRRRARRRRRELRGQDAPRTALCPPRTLRHRRPDHCQGPQLARWETP